MSTSVAPVPPNQEQQLTNFHKAMMILPISLIGMFVNFITILVMTKHKNFKNPFGYQMNFHAICNFFECFVFATYVVISLIWGLPSYLFYFNIRVGQLMLFLCLSSYHICLAISINRVVAIGLPYKYGRIYSKRGTLIIIGIAAFFGLAYALIYSTEYCYFLFDPAAGGFMFSATPMGDFMAYVDMRYTVTLFTVVGICDLTALILLRRHRKKLESTTSDHSRRRMIQESRFFLQALGTSIVYMAITFSYHVLYYQMSTPLGQFATTTLAWPICSTCPGIILILFNREMSNCILTLNFLKLKLWNSPQNTTIFVASISKNTK